MQIAGPLTIGIVEQEDGGQRELHLNFTPEFCSLDLQAQTEELNAYVHQLNESALELASDDPNRIGMLLIQQIAEQLVPHVAAGELALQETIVIAIDSEEDTPQFALKDLLN